MWATAVVLRKVRWLRNDTGTTLFSGRYCDLYWSCSVIWLTTNNAAHFVKRVMYFKTTMESKEIPIIVVDFGKRVIANINGTIYSSPELKQKTLYGQASMTQMTTIRSAYSIAVILI